MAFEIDPDYVDVAERIRDFRSQHQNGSLQQHDLQFVTFADRCWIVYTAAAYRAPDDARPGMGTAWEPVPGKTPYTRDSELQNAETAAWGRAIVAALAADTKKVASADEIRARQDDRPAPRATPGPSPRAEALARLFRVAVRMEPDLNDEDRQTWLNGEMAARGLDGSKTADLAALAADLEKLTRTGGA